MFVIVSVIIVTAVRNLSAKLHNNTLLFLIVIIVTVVVVIAVVVIVTIVFVTIVVVIIASLPAPMRFTGGTGLQQ